MSESLEIGPVERREIRRRRDQEESRSGGCEECSMVSFPLHPLSCCALNKMRYTDGVRGAYTEKVVHQNDF